MNKQEVQDRIQLKRLELAKENDSNKLRVINNDIHILQLRYQIEIFKERIENLRR